MNITTVTVTIHEKRAHPHAMGHKDCEITLTAELDPGDELHGILDLLRFRANMHVNKELDEWIDGIKAEQELAALRNDLTEKLRSVRWANSTKQLEEVRLDTITTIELLTIKAGANIDEQNEAYKELEACVGAAVKRIANQKDNGAESEILF